MMMHHLHVSKIVVAAWGAPAVNDERASDLFFYKCCASSNKEGAILLLFAY